jgi:hypothetical protein
MSSVNFNIKAPVKAGHTEIPIREPLSSFDPLNSYGYENQTAEPDEEFCRLK